MMMAIDSTVRWFVAQTHACAEEKAARHLNRQGFTVYLPKYLKRRRHARKVDVVSAPLFPRYLFVGVDAMVRQWRSVQSTVGITNVITNGENPAWVPDGVVADIRAREGEDGYIQLSAKPLFNRGDSIRVAEGAFTACLGLFEGLTDKERVTVLLDLLGRKVRVVMDMAMIEAA